MDLRSFAIGCFAGIAICMGSLIGVSYIAGIRWQLVSRDVVKTVTQPEDCKALGLKPTGWEFQALYKGGINKGGSSSFITFECK